MKTLLTFILLALAAPAFGQTLLVGTNVESSESGAIGPNTYGDIEETSFTAVATGSATDGYFYTFTASHAYVLAVYNAAGTSLLGTSSEISSSTVGWNHVTFSPTISIVSGTTYMLAIFNGTNAVWNAGQGAAGQWFYFNPASAIFPTPPSTYSASSSGAAFNLSVYLESAGSTSHPSQFFFSSNVPRRAVVPRTTSQRAGSWE